MQQPKTLQRITSKHLPLWSRSTLHTKNRLQVPLRQHTRQSNTATTLQRGVKTHRPPSAQSPYSQPQRAHRPQRQQVHSLMMPQSWHTEQTLQQSAQVKPPPAARTPSPMIHSATRACSLMYQTSGASCKTGSCRTSPLPASSCCTEDGKIQTRASLRASGSRCRPGISHAGLASASPHAQERLSAQCEQLHRLHLPCLQIPAVRAQWSKMSTPCTCRFCAPFRP